MRKCELCDNPAMHIHAECHITAPLRAEIKGDKILLFCYIPQCSRLVAQFKYYDMELEPKTTIESKK